MKKTLISILFSSIIFSQSTSNQVSYIIYTNGKFYSDVILHSVQGSDLLINENNSTKKYTIPISNISGIRIKEDRSNLNRKPSGCVYGLGLGALVGGLIGLGMEQGRGDATSTGFIIPFLPVAILGGMGIGALIGSISAESSNGRQNPLVSLENKSFDEKIYYLKSIAKQ